MFVLFQVTTETYGLKFSGYWQSMGRKCSLPSYKNETRLILANMKLANNNFKTRVRTSKKQTDPTIHIMAGIDVTT